MFMGWGGGVIILGSYIFYFPESSLGDISHLHDCLHFVVKLQYLTTLVSDKILSTLKN